ncbi:response regulator [Dyadobacter sp. CY345]|uniref:response regulator n=1 Tax=Dyadobacter sp. CY345 TaxID=2909335 RepID=UPI001F26F481|nr:response regulator [Dyadobacter sp. CY345]MCF2443305.1 response regulator [Dyadobacter sp. CY345]
MNKNGNIIVIEDDEDDQYIMEQAFESLGYGNKRKYFTDGISALNYLRATDDLPFLILSDINMPVLNGFELREKVFNDAELALKCIPYLFFSTALNQRVVIDAYSSSAQGFFVKQNSFGDLVDSLRVIMEYWKKCAAPNNF